jgi:aspartyl-tRNA(Asn)/glutamyl-tRNA(Gln) amidotransferase subunit A
MDEFAMGAESDTSFSGPVRNPHNEHYSPGGSSGGSAAAVAASSAPLSLGSDTGGSVRQPAACCGLVGYKPSYGAVSRYGLIAYAGSFDQIGPICKNVTDAALLMAAIAGHDALDAMSHPQAVFDFASINNFCVKGKKIGILRECFTEGISGEVREAVMSAVKAFESLGAETADVTVPNIEHSLPAYYAMALAEASSGLSKLDGIRFGHRVASCPDIDSLYVNSRTEGFGEEVKKRIIIGTYLLSAGNYEIYYKKARIIRAMLRDGFAAAFSQFDILLAPVMPKAAHALGQRETDPAALYLSDICTVPVNLAGLPAISVPCGKGAGALPIGVQLIGRWLGDADLLGFARAYEQERGDIA